MSRPRGPSGPGISLFPFLAVLLCTMGALLVVLVIFSRSSTEQAAQAEAASTAELEAARDALRARLDVLERLRRHAADQLSQSRLRLAGIEEHARGLQDEMASLQRSLESLAAGKNVPVDAAHDSELARRLAEARETLERVKAEAGTKPAAYAVVPYEGAGGTRRRPLYIECCGDGVFLQPEGVRLRPSDFEGPPGPGNPLASGLRAAREHLASRPDAAGTTEAQPYPLLLVRPSGVMAYYAAREAIGSWGSDFGYQLVDEDWTLAFPPADPTLADVESRAIEEARARLQWLAEVRPKRPAKPATRYRAATTRGGVVSTEGPSVLGDQSRFDWSDADTDRGPRGDALGRTGGGSGGPGGSGGRGGPGTAAGSLASAGGRGLPDGYGMADGRAAAGGQFGPPAGIVSGDALPGTSTGGSGRAEAAAGGIGGSESSGRTSSLSSTAAAGSTATADASSGGGPSSGSAAAGAGQAAGTSAGVAMPGLLQPQGGQSAGGGAASVSIATSRGRNWASLASRDRPIPLSRPIQVECAADEFRIYDDANRRVVRRIAIEGATAAAVDPLVKAIHERVATWGIAGDRMYWKPQLFLSETPDGGARRGDLERLLADSGIETLHRGSTVAPLPAVADPPATATRPVAPRDTFAR